MFIGHIGAGLALKKPGRKINLGVIVFAALFADFLLGILLLAGVERLVVPGMYAELHYLTFEFPFSHGMVATLCWMAFGTLVFFFFSGRQVRLALFIPAIAVFSHFVLDVIVHVPDIPLFGTGSSEIGLGLWDYLPLALLFETAVFGAGLYVYMKTVRLRKGALIAVIAVAVLLTVMTVTGQALADTAPEPAVLAWSLIFQTVLISGLAVWLDLRGRLLRNS